MYSMSFTISTNMKGQTRLLLKKCIAKLPVRPSWTSTQLWTFGIFREYRFRLSVSSNKYYVKSNWQQYKHEFSSHTGLLLKQTIPALTLSLQQFQNGNHSASFQAQIGLQFLAPWPRIWTSPRKLSISQCNFEELLFYA